MLTRDRILERLRDQPVGAVFNGLVDRVVCRTMSPGAAVDAVISAIQPGSLVEVETERE
jgi:hypothetical protein